MNTLDNYIKDSQDEALESWGTTKPYLEMRELINARLATVSANLSEEMQLELNRALNLIDRQHAETIDVIYRAGIMNGIGAGIKML